MQLSSGDHAITAPDDQHSATTYEVNTIHLLLPEQCCDAFRPERASNSDSRGFFQCASSSQSIDSDFDVDDDDVVMINSHLCTAGSRSLCN